MTKHSFQADVAKVLDIVIHSLYSKKDIFLRELISNASDACDKLRYIGQINPNMANLCKDLKIQIIPDAKENTLTVSDNGIGMNEEDLINNLGKIAWSGSTEFLKNLTGDKNKDASLIGQFGVGFYSAFMVAKKVEVISHKAGEEKTFLWRSSGGADFVIEEAKDIPVGTKIILYLNKDDSELTNPIRIRSIIKQYSDHIGFPIYIGKEQINDSSALWMKPKSEITDIQYREFYHHIAKSFDEPWMTIHYKTEGTIEYTALLYIPSQIPFDLFQPDKKHTLNLYVNRVFISDEIEDLLPRYLRFVRGVVDTSDLPLNVSREILQHNPILSKIKKGLTTHILKELKKAEKYDEFWKNFGVVFKEGLYEEHTDELADLCRFNSTNSEELTTLSDYVSRMKPEQKNIYYLTGDHLDVLKHNPNLSLFKEKGIEVLLLTDAIDEFWPQTYPKYKDFSFKSVLHPGDDVEKLLLTDKSEQLSDIEKNVLLEKVREILKDQNLTVEYGKHLGENAVTLKAGEGQMSIHLERLMKTYQQSQMFPSNRIFELNPNHTLIHKIAQKAVQKEDISSEIWVLYNTARIIEGEPIINSKQYIDDINRLLEK